MVKPGTLTALIKTENVASWKCVLDPKGQNGSPSSSSAKHGALRMGKKPIIERLVAWLQGHEDKGNGRIGSDKVSTGT